MLNGIKNYHLPDFVVKSTAVPVSGRFLAHNHHDRVAHAFMAADLVGGRTHLVRPTVTQAAFLAGVNRAYAHWAIKRQDERAAIESGLIPLVPAPSPKANGGMLPMSITGRMPDSDLVDFVKSVGVERVLEAAVAVEAAQ
jgi:hypothetical protein